LPLDIVCQTSILRLMGKPQHVTAIERLRGRLEEKGWSQSRLGEEISVSSAVVSRWLSGDRTPSLEMACRIENALGIPVEAWREERAAS
jgi:transcriptional regulator with XRE-family HTH domain